MAAFGSDIGVRLRRGSRPWQVLEILTSARDGMRAGELNQPGRIVATTRQIGQALLRLDDDNLATTNGGTWFATPAGFATIRAANAGPQKPTRLTTSFAEPRIPMGATARRDFPLVLRPGAEDYRQHPSRRGRLLVWDHLDGRREQLT